MTTIAKTKASANAIIEDVAAQAKENFEGFVKAGQEQAQKHQAQAQKHIEQTVAATKQQVEKAQAQMIKGYDEFAAFQKGNVDALMQSGAVVAKGAEDIGKEVAAFAQASFDKSVAASKAMMSAKTIQEAVDLQSTFAKTSFDSFVAQAGKLQELSVKIANAAIAPINARVNVAVETLSKPIAA